MKGPETRSDEDDKNPFYTVLVMAPSGFTNSTNSDSGDADTAMHCIKRSKLASETACIVYGLKQIEHRWSQLDRQLDDLLAEDFMNPEKYVELLIEDDNFTRSKLYFWIAKAINEFIISISENIKQWDLYRHARIQPWVSGNTTEERQSTLRVWDRDDELWALDGQAEMIKEGLEELKKGLQNKLQTVEAVRGGVSHILYSFCQIALAL